MQMPMTLSRSLLTVIVPGTIALSPWALLLVQYTDATLGFDTNPTIAHTLYLSGIVVAGVLCETMGTILESRWDGAQKNRRLNIQANFYDYLAKVLPAEPVAYRYISRLVTAMYFELAMVFAMPSFIGGGALLAVSRFPELKCMIVLMSAIAAAATFFFFLLHARTTHRVINITRYEVLKRMR